MQYCLTLYLLRLYAFSYFALLFYTSLSSFFYLSLWRKTLLLSSSEKLISHHANRWLVATPIYLISLLWKLGLALGLD